MLMAMVLNTNFQIVSADSLQYQKVFVSAFQNDMVNNSLNPFIQFYLQTMIGYFNRLV